MTAILRLHHATLSIPPGGEARARAFYIGLLGFREIAKPAGLRPGGLWLEAGAKGLTTRAKRLTTVNEGLTDAISPARADGSAMPLGKIGEKEVARVTRVNWGASPPLQLHLTIQEGIDRQKNRAHLAFLVANLPALRAHLSAAGVEIHEPVGPIPGYERWECQDPFGNRLEFLMSLPLSGATNESRR